MKLERFAQLDVRMSVISGVSTTSINLTQSMCITVLVLDQYLHGTEILF